MTSQIYLDPTKNGRHYLRRYSLGLCPLKEGDQSFHDARVAIGIGPADQITGDVYPHADARWPTKCSCGYPFGEKDSKHLFIDRLYARSDTGEEVTLSEAPDGAKRRPFTLGPLS